MIDIKSLRIGNYYNCPNEKQNPFRIDIIEYLYPSNQEGKLGMFINGFENCHPLTWYFKDLQPIPLTEQILLDLGFEKVNDDYFKKIGDYKFMVNLFEKEISIQGSFEELIGFGFDQLELHSLQNIVYDISGKELEFKK